MKQYHTEIVIDATVERTWQVLADFEKYPDWNPLVGWLEGDLRENGSINMLIRPLDKAFNASLKTFEENAGFTWVGVSVASWFLSGEHYYRLEKISNTKTRLLHGEYFRGLGSFFVSRALLAKMENTFHQHNLKLKEIIEND